MSNRKAAKKPQVGHSTEPSLEFKPVVVPPEEMEFKPVNGL